MRIGMMIGEGGSLGGTLDALVAQVQGAESDGLHTAWFPNIFGIDAMTLATVAGRVTSRIELGTAVVPTYPRHPMAMAQQALSTQVACGNRFALGIGLSHQVVIESMFGMSFAKPYSHMKEYLAVLAPLIRDGSVSFRGDAFRVTGNLKVEGAKPCSILLAALAPKMLGLAGSVGDGTITWMTGPKTLREHTVPRINEAASQAGRPAPRVVAGLPIAITSDVAGAKAIAGQFFQIYGVLPSYRAMLDREGVEGPADVALAGDEDTVAGQIAALGKIGVTDFLAAPFPVGKDPGASLDRTMKLLSRLARS
ncbi:MAG: TIGR03564 family F420-dependent LLM class oxidoreductase [Deltaproteobacteria bacterium]|nr:TIGR03564 family F420-dependent LLM class oxidoreductase [Deltaproteobacteria bacterium]